MAVVSLAILAYIAVVITGTYATSTNTSLAEQANLDLAISQQIASSLDYVHKSDINIAPLAIPLHDINLSANQFILLYDSTPYASEGHIALNLAAEFTVNGADSISYKVSVTNMEKVTAAHIHKGNVGENGLVVVTLFKTDSPSASTNGILSQGTVSSAKLEGPLAGKQLSNLINMINNGGRLCQCSHTSKSQRRDSWAAIFYVRDDITIALNYVFSRMAYDNICVCTTISYFINNLHS